MYIIIDTHFSLHVRESRTVLDPGFHAVDYGFQIPGTGFQSLSVELGLWISILAGFWIPKLKIPDSISKIFWNSGFRNRA